MMTAQNPEELYTLVDRTLEDTMNGGRFLFNMYNYLEASRWTRKQVQEFLESSVAEEVTGEISELDIYIKGGDPYMREAYHHIPKPRARKIRDYLHKMIDDAQRYSDQRRPGRKKGSKNRTK
tara:strand:- start:108 stop:473 length:366 start_codon:yes stop_codon:yes gene_type:complete